MNLVWIANNALDAMTSAPAVPRHPVHCLEAQLENVYDQLNRRAEPGGERYIGRVRLAIEACRRITLQHLNQGDARSALKVVEKVHALSLLPTAMRMRFEDGIQVERGIAEEAMPEDFLKKAFATTPPPPRTSDQDI
jgi:hypothetical protein